MGLMDILNGMQNGPRGGADRSGGGGMSPLTMALLALLAYKAMKSFGGSQATAPAAPAPTGTPSLPGAAPTGGAAGGGLTAGLDDLLRGGGASAGTGAGAGAGAGGLGGLGGILSGLQGGAGAGGLGGILGGLLGGAGAAGGLGGLLTGGLGELLDQFHGAGKGAAASSWVGGGQNHALSTEDLAQVLTPDQIDFLTQQTGMSRQALLSGLSEQLPGLVDQLTPDGRLPTADEMNRVV
ncbi:MAG: DUF937 domain-containing protein [Proteobacteria bacterium]|nr:DUF937 domain-containing protein [Pseudomonadota bacterium]